LLIFVSVFISFEPISIIVFNGALPHAAGSLLPSVSTDGLKIRRQSLFLCGLKPLSVEGCFIPF
jgi:hypothetical protein